MKTTRTILEKLLRVLIVTAIITNAVFPSVIKAQDEEETAEATLPLKGRTISFLGDSISTYYGYSDVNPLTDEGVAHRYGEPYYGPEGTDCHNTDLSVEDTWWHQSLQQLGAELLISNATNSSAVFTASYPDDEDWDAYLKDMLAYKTRPYHLGTDDKDPDIIALYIGSGDAGWGNVDKYGDISTVRFDEIITPTRDGSYAYGEPQTVAEAYCIMLHKISVTYPQAEIYVFTVVPNSGGSTTTLETRIGKVVPFNEMLKGVAEYHHLTVVDLFEAFEVDPDGDGKMTEEELATFKSYFAEGPHPNAEGFDIITDAFNAAVLKNSRYVVTVESKAGVYESVETDVVSQSENSQTTITRSAEDYITDQEMTVDYESTDVLKDNGDRNFTDHYTSQNKVDTYEAEGGSDITVTHHAPAGVVDITIVMDELDEDEAIAVEEPVNPPVQKGLRGTVITGDPKESEDDGIYDYTITDDSQQGSISVVTKSISISKVTGDVQPDDMEYVVSQAVPTADNGLIYNSNIPELIIPDPADINIPEGYSYLYVGHKNFSNYWAAYGYTEPDMEGFPTEEPIYTDDDLSIYVWAAHSVFTGNRRLVVPKLYLSNKVVEGRYPARWDSIELFAMVDENANEITAYCADKNTSAEQGYYYNISNLEDANYYTEEEAKMIRSIASHGYWGTQSGFGSLDSLKQMLLEDGGFTQDEVDAINDGMAMTATQYAIWSFSNKMDKVIFYNAYYSNRL
ncbi:MAG: Cys-Gln thioester bond-forming surface protein, partial [Erysipelotrichaceae bacterium]|nr:Cys-Gln thioester bond-forming surface protein [Erysipelotrichaceae bacterium]